MNSRALRSRNESTQTHTKKFKGTSDTEVSEKSDEPKSKLAKRSTTTGKAAGRKARAKAIVEVDSEDPENKENSPVQPTRASRVPAARRVKKEVKDVPVMLEEVDAPRMTRTRARKLK